MKAIVCRRYGSTDHIQVVEIPKPSPGAEFLCASEEALTAKPSGVSFEDAAAIAEGGAIALQGIRDRGRVQPGHHVLINGAGGGGGTLAVQVAKSMGARVMGVDSAAKLEMLRSLGADEVLDYRRDDFTRKGRRYDLILDLAGYRSLFDHRRALSPGGTYLMVGGATARVLQTLIVGPLMRSGGRRMQILAVRPNRDLDEMADRLASGTLATTIDKTFPLTDAANAIRYVGEGHARGKIVLTI